MSSHVEWFIVEVHGQVKRAKIRSYLEALGFRLIEQLNHNQIYYNQRLTPSASHYQVPANGIVHWSISVDSREVVRS